MGSRYRRARRAARRFVRRVRFARRTPQILRITRWAVALCVAGAAAWILVTGILARQELSAMQLRITQVRLAVAAGDITRAGELAESVPAGADRAHALTSGPVWWAAAQLPFVGDPAVVIRGSTTAAHRLSVQVVPRLVRTARHLDPARLRVSGSTVDVAALAAEAPSLQAAADAVDRTGRDLRRVPTHTWLGPVDSARSQFARQLTALQGYADAAARVSRVLPVMLGQHGTQRYFVGLQNEAELRGTGGLPGAFAIVSARAGRLHFDRFESDLALLPAATGGRVPTGLDFGAGYRSAYGASDPTSSYVDSNASPEFPYAARIWAAMWEKVSGERVDGVLALDPTSLQYFLAAVGPVTLPGGVQLSARNVVALTERDQYARYPNLAERKKFVVSVLRGTARQLTSGAGSAVGVLQAASRSSQQRRMLVWSRDPAVERVLATSNYAGALPAGGRPVSAVVLNNAAGGKLDFYLRRSLAYERVGCGSRRDVVATVTLHNGAPPSGLPSYVTTRFDRAPAAARPGDSRALFDYYATGGARLLSITVNGRPSTASAFSVSGHGVFRLDLELPRGTTTTVVLHLSEPAGTGDPVIWRQPGVTPLAVQEFNQSC